MKKALLLALASVALVAVAVPVEAAEDGKWMMRGRMIYVSPNADGEGAVEGIDVDSQFTFEVDFTRFFGKSLAVEVVLATTSHDVQDEDGDSVGSVDLLPPTFTAQWHFNTEGTIKPYVGAGFNYTSFYNSTGDLQDVDFDDSLSYAAQAGIDWKCGETALVNFDVKYIGIETDVTAGNVDLGTVTIDPLVIGVGLGFRF